MQFKNLFTDWPDDVPEEEKLVWYLYEYGNTRLCTLTQLSTTTNYDCRLVWWMRLEIPNPDDYSEAQEAVSQASMEKMND